MTEHRIEVAGEPEAVLSAIDEAAELWGADWQPLGTGGRIALPVSAGLRHGLVDAEIFVESAARGSLVVLHIHDSRYFLRAPAVVILLLGALGALATVFVPFFPRLFGVMPLAALLALGAWFLVVSRLRISGPQDFLQLVAKLRSPQRPANSR